MVMGGPRSNPTNLPAGTVPIGSTPIDRAFLSELREHVAAREIERGIACLQRRHELIGKLDPRQQNAGRLAAQLAIWTDIGFTGPPLREILNRFKPESRSDLS